MIFLKIKENLYHVAWFYVDSCKAKKHVQEDKKNKRQIELDGGYLIFHTFQIGLTHLKMTIKVFKGHFQPKNKIF